MPAKKIIEYCGGAKGDFLTNWISGSVQFDQMGRSNPATIFFKQITAESTGKINSDFIQQESAGQRIIDLFNSTANKNLPVIPGHGTLFLPANAKDFINLNYQVYKINCDRSVWPTVDIERIFKQECRPSVHRPGFYTSFRVDKTDDRYYQIKYWMDIWLLNNGIELSDGARADRLGMLLDQVEKNIAFAPSVQYFSSPDKYGIENTVQLQYRDLYLDFKLDDRLFPADTDVSAYQHAVGQTWLPDQPHMFGRVWNLPKFGYRQF
jgi:hypothetical protein